jgi:hypothetical protein
MDGSRRRIGGNGIRQRGSHARVPCVASARILARAGLAALAASVMVAGGALADEAPAAAAPAATVPPPARTAATARTAQPATAGTIEHRVAVLAKALDLDAKQKTELRRILERQREDVRRIWSNTALLPAERAPATRAAADRTADEIRGILNDEQKQRYNPPKPPAPPPGESGPPNVAAWMDATRPKQAR